MGKKDIIERIQRINPTATTGFLLSFSEPQLQQYLDHLLAVFGEERAPVLAEAPAAVDT